MFFEIILRDASPESDADALRQNREAHRSVKDNARIRIFVDFFIFVEFLS